ncbi:MAG TPA: hypothetical protein DCG52_07050 [Alphaproteobacteria bacterium]|nr:hypothetical protein [Alphaproteobacteria bacterium]
MELSKEPWTSLLAKLAEDEDWVVRSFVAENNKTPVSALEKLAGDEDRNVRCKVVQNVNTHPLLKFV